MLSLYRRIKNRQVVRRETLIETREIPNSPLLHRQDNESESTTTQIDDSEVCVISVDSLRCSICYTIFNDTPLMLQCGHSFCTACVSRMMAQTRNSRSNAPVQCPICRKRVNFKFAAKNYALKSILDSIDEISTDEEVQAYANTMEVTIDQLRQQLNEARKQDNQPNAIIIEVTNELLREQLAEVEKATDQLKTDLRKSQRDAIRNYIIMVFVVVLIFFYLKHF